ncbi:hypothetical protein [uncultured Desulfosarcina sp.]|uniref:hypothetical protein n=1 Tax=uncultured Desulfosarcina sp. TaxID=218289 RepID=UPI0029C6BB93|nr:hypothetical protein [uncultured Desulfosarcina sp.]
MKGHNLSIAQNSGVTIVTNNVDAEDMNGPRPETRFHEVDGSQTLTVGPSHPLYDTPTTMAYNPSMDEDTSPAEGFVTKQGTVQGDRTDERNTLLRVNGMEVDLPTAMKHGLVEKSATGYLLTDKAKGMMKSTPKANKGSKAKGKEQNASTNVADTKARSAGIARLEQAVGGPALHNVIQTTLSALSNGQQPKDMSSLETAARAAGMSHKQVVDTISNAVQGSEIRAKGALKKAGINPNGVFGHLYNNVDVSTRVTILSGLIAGDPAALNYAVELAKTGNKK